MKLIKKIYSITVFIEFVLFLFFILENINNLSDIEFQLILGGETHDLNINIYSVFSILGILFTFVILSSLNLFGISINEYGTKMIGKYLGITALFIMLSMGLAYYIYPLGSIGLVVQLLTLVVFLLYAIDSLNEGGDE